MKKILLISIAAVCFLSCNHSDKEISVRISLYQTDYYDRYYIKTVIKNNTFHDYFIPGLYKGSFSVMSPSGLDLTKGYWTRKDWPTGYFDTTGAHIRGDTISITDLDKCWIYGESALEKEAEIFAEMNDIADFDIWKDEESDVYELFNILVSSVKYNGVALRAGEQATFYDSVGCLFDKTTGRPIRDLVIKFRYWYGSDYSLFDTITMNGYKFNTVLLDDINGYKIYDGEIKCDDAVYLTK